MTDLTIKALLCFSKLYTIHGLQMVAIRVHFSSFLFVLDIVSSEAG